MSHISTYRVSTFKLCRLEKAYVHAPTYKAEQRRKCCEGRRDGTRNERKRACAISPLRLETMAYFIIRWKYLGIECVGSLSNTPLPQLR